MSHTLDRSMSWLPLAVPGAYRLCAPGKEQEPAHAQAAMGNEIKELVRKLAIAHPNWVFINSTTYSTVVNEMSVYERDTWVGDINAHRDYRGNPVYNYTNHRIRAVLQRGSWRKTTNLNKAVKDINTHFTLPTLMERVNAGYNNVYAILSRTSSEANSAFRAVWNKNEAQIIRTLAGDKSALSDDTITEIISTAKRREAIDALFVEFGAYNGTMCLLEGDEAHVVTLNTNSERQATTVQFNVLPQIAQVKIGLLKLQDKPLADPLLGIRNGNMFFVTHEELPHE